MRRVRALLEAVLLLAMGLGSVGFALLGSYEQLMNPDFRAITVAGGVLLALLGAVLLRHPRREAGPAALLVLLVLVAVMAIGRPFAPVGGAAAFGVERPPALAREGYEPLETRALFASIDEEAEVADGTYVLSGSVHRSEAMDAEGEFILFEPRMACCLADALALGVRVKTSAPLPAAKTWIYVYGTLRTLDEPVTIPRIRFGAVIFTNVSRVHLLAADQIVSFRSLLADVAQSVPEKRCAVFRDALESTGLAEDLRREGSFTVFVPLDLAFERLPAARRAALFAPENRARLRTLLESFVVAGAHYERDLFEVDSLTTLSGRTLRVEAVNGRLRIEGARVLFGDQIARNGVLHVVHPAWIVER